MPASNDQAEEGPGIRPGKEEARGSLVGFRTGHIVQQEQGQKG